MDGDQDLGALVDQFLLEEMVLSERLNELKIPCELFSAYFSHVRKLVDHVKYLSQQSSELKGSQKLTYAESEIGERLGTEITTIAHDLNNILAPFFMVIKVLEEKLHDDVEAKTLLTILKTNTERGANLSERIISLFYW